MEKIRKNEQRTNKRSFLLYVDNDIMKDFKVHCAQNDITITNVLRICAVPKNETLN